LFPSHPFVLSLYFFLPFLLSYFFCSFLSPFLASSLFISSPLRPSYLS
jgi:hypothetical protein